MASLVLLPSNQGHPELFDIDYNCDEMDKKTTILLKMVAVKYASDERAIGLRWSWKRTEGLETASSDLNPLFDS